MSKLFTKPTYFELNGEVASAIPTSDGGVEITKPTSMYFAEFLQDGSEITKVAYDKLHKKALIKYEQKYDNKLTNRGKKNTILRQSVSRESGEGVAGTGEGKGKNKKNKKEQDSEIVFVPNLV